MSEFDRLYDTVLDIAGGGDLLSSFSKLSSDRERAEAVLTLDALQGYRAPSNFAGKCSAEEAEKLAVQCGLESDPWRARSLYSGVIRTAPTGGPLLSKGYEARCALLRREGVYSAALADALQGLRESPCIKTKISLLQLTAGCYQQLAQWREAEDYYQQALTVLRTASVSNETKAKLAMELVNGLRQTKLHENSKINSKNSNEIDNRVVSLLPELDYGVNSQMACCSAAVGLRWSTEKGRHLVANNDVVTGSVLIVEQPFAWSLSREALEDHCLHCCCLLVASVPCTQCSTVSFCSDSCRDLAWNSYHKRECSVLGHFLEEGRLSRMALVVYRILLTCIPSPPQLSAHFKELHSASTHPLQETYDGGYCAVYDQVTNSDSRSPSDLLQRAVSAVFLVRCLQRIWTTMNEEEEIVLVTAALRHLQSCSCNAYQMCEQRVVDDNVRESVGLELGGAVYPTVSLSNHGCYPNIARHSYDRVCVVRAIRSIRKGEELFDNYGPHFLSHKYAERQELLKSQYAFQCACQACNGLWPTGDILQKQITEYKCGHCYKNIGKSLIINCPHCKKKNLSFKKTQKQLQEMEKKYKNGVEGLLRGRVQDCLEICIRYASLLEKVVVEPNMELVKCQQAIAYAWSLQANVDNKSKKL